MRYTVAHYETPGVAYCSYPLWRWYGAPRDLYIHKYMFSPCSFDIHLRVYIIFEVYFPSTQIRTVVPIFGMDAVHMCR
jgi:hypothetical protein